MQLQHAPARVGTSAWPVLPDPGFCWPAATGLAHLWLDPAQQCVKDTRAQRNTAVQRGAGGWAGSTTGGPRTGPRARQCRACRFDQQVQPGRSLGGGVHRPSAPPPLSTCAPNTLVHRCSMQHTVQRAGLCSMQAPIYVQPASFSSTFFYFILFFVLPFVSSFPRSCLAFICPRLCTRQVLRSCTRRSFFFFFLSFFWRSPLTPIPLKLGGTNTRATERCIRLYEMLTKGSFLGLGLA